MRPMAAAAIGALVAGVGMYAVGARAQNNPFAEVPALVQTVDGQFVRVPGAQPVSSGFNNGFSNGFVSAPQPAAMPVYVQRTAAPRTVYRTAPAAQSERVVVTEQAAPKRSWKKRALVIGGSAAGGAGVGGLIGGKKGALIGAALGGGAASIYEATKH
jgi:hypothetical protein